MTECLVVLERDSVCMGDDADAPHSHSFKVPAEATLNEVFEVLGSRRYLPSVAGSNHSWEATAGGKFLAMFKGNSQRPEVSTALGTPVSDHASDGVLSIRFKYNSAVA